MSLNLNTVAKNVINNTIELFQCSEISVAQFADAVGLSKSTLYRMGEIKMYGEEKAYRPQLSTIIKLANAADVSVETFLTQKLDVQ